MKKKLFGVKFSDLKTVDILEYIDELLKKGTKNYFFVTPNPEILMLARSQDRYKNILNDAELALADGVGVIWASKLLGDPIYHRTTGVDLTEMVCEYVVEKPITVGFLGGGPGVAEKAADCLMKKYPGLRVLLTYAGSTDRETIVAIKNQLAEKNTKKLDILFVAFGSPKQEIWIAENLKDLPVVLTIGVGGSFDFVSGNVRRAPLWMRKIGLEWFFRLIIQPWRIKRQISLIRFVFLVLKEKLFAKS